MAFLAVTGPQDLMLRLPRQESVSVGILVSSAEENDDGTWSVTVYARDDQVPALEALGYTVRVVTTDAQLRSLWQELDVDRPVA
jgi:hypothetical protein